MTRIAIVTDSSSDLTLDICKENNIAMVPLTVHFGSESYIDRVEITSAQFFEKLVASSVMPKTSQPSPADFEKVYRQILEDHDYVFSVHISSSMSGTCQSAMIAAEAVNPGSIEVIDGRAVSLVTGLMVLSAAEGVRAGESVEEIRNRIHFVMDNFGLYWTLDTLEYLRKNGRIGRATAFIGGLLSIKPIMSITDGEISGVERVRGVSRVFPRIIELMEADIAPGSPIDVVVLHAADEVQGCQWMNEVKSRFNCRRLWLTECGPIVGTHAGPGTMAVAWRPSIIK
ncbi:MAG: DegV family protein [Clostridia bacterium]|nr:DegV family protein [Clostridia bacterium]